VLAQSAGGLLLYSQLKACSIEPIRTLTVTAGHFEEEVAALVVLETMKLLVIYQSSYRRGEGLL